MSGRILTFPLTRLLLSLALFFVLTQLGEWGWSLAVGLPASALVSRAIITLAALGALFAVGRVIERRGLAALGFSGRHALRDLGLGLLLGAALLTATVGVMALAGWYRVVGFLWEQPNANVGYVVVVGLLYYGLVAVSEEILFRGVGFRLIEEWLGTWAAFGLSALIFGLFHLSNQNATLWSTLALALGSGVFFAAGYVLARNLWLPIGMHWTWNYFQGIVYGTPVSGSQQPGLLKAAIAGPELWTGGAFGPEAGLAMLIICVVVSVLLLVFCQRRQRIIAPAWLRHGEALSLAG